MSICMIFCRKKSFTPNMRKVYFDFVVVFIIVIFENCY